MATQYTSILKLALPVQGELSGTWGDVVNDNITSMVEEAIAGRAVINTWTANSHTLTTADGTTSESRAAILTLTDTGTALTGAGTVICPAASKIYIVENGTGQTITVKTASGTGIAVPNTKNMVVFCDGTNVEEGITNINSLTLNGDGATVSSIKDEDNMASDSATALATQQSIKAYVDSQVGTVDTLAEVLANGNTTGGTDIAVSSGDDITFADNSKAIFGAGSDFSIYHDGSNSRIHDAGTGDLLINGQANIILGALSGEEYIRATENGAVSIKYDNATKLATTSTGIDVTGTLVSDGLTVDGGTTLNTSSTVFANLNYSNSNLGKLSTDGINVNFEANSNLFLKANSATRAKFDGNGDISFYEDTGTTAKLTWSAANESLTFGTNLAITTNEIDVATGDLTLDVAGDIVLNADGGDWKFQDASASILEVQNDGNGNAVIITPTSDKDIKFLGNDGGSTISALTLDMSEAGEATFNSDIRLNDGKVARFGTDQDFRIGFDGTGAVLQNVTSDSDILFKGNDGGSTITALSLDMSEAGAATFNAGATFGSGIDVTGTVTADVTRTSGANTNAFVLSDNVTGLQTGGFGTRIIGQSNSGAAVSAIGFEADGGTNNDTAISFYTQPGAGSLKRRMKLGLGGDISFYEDTGTTAKFFWDASAESLGINSSSPTATLDVRRSDASGIIAEFHNNVGYGIDIGSSTAEAYISSGYQQDFLFKTNAGSGQTERMRIDSSGNLLMGRTTTPPTADAKIAIAGTGNTAVQITKDGVIAGRVMAVTTGLAFGVDGSDGATERMQLDSSGNLLVGKTNNTLSNDGTIIRAGGELLVTNTSDIVANFNRTGTDGAISTFYKDGSTVGSIGVNSATPYMSGNLGGFRLTSASGAGVMIPTDISGNNSDADNDLGISSVRWRDLYLSGGVYLGGTGSANKLDDYEEGTFTPTIIGGTTTGTGTYVRQTGRYTKVGQLVHVQITLGWSAHTGTGELKMTGLPFTSVAGLAGQSGLGIHYNNGLNHASGTTFGIYVSGGTADAIFTESTAGGSLASIAMDTVVSELIISGTYHAA